MDELGRESKMPSRSIHLFNTCYGWPSPMDTCTVFYVSHPRYSTVTPLLRVRGVAYSRCRAGRPGGGGFPGLGLTQTALCNFWQFLAVFWGNLAGILGW